MNIHLFIKIIVSNQLDLKSVDMCFGSTLQISCKSLNT